MKIEFKLILFCLSLVLSATSYARDYNIDIFNYTNESYRYEITSQDTKDNRCISTNPNSGDIKPLAQTKQFFRINLQETSSGSCWNAASAFHFHIGPARFEYHREAASDPGFIMQSDPTGKMRVPKFADIEIGNKP